MFGNEDPMRCLLTILGSATIPLEYACKRSSDASDASRRGRLGAGRVGRAVARLFFLELNS